MCAYFNKGTNSIQLAKAESSHAHKGLALPSTSHFGEIALVGLRRLRIASAAASTLSAHAAVTEAQSK